MNPIRVARRIAVALVIGIIATVAIAWVGAVASPGILWHGHVLWPRPQFNAATLEWIRAKSDLLGRRVTTPPGVMYYRYGSGRSTASLPPDQTPRVAELASRLAYDHPESEWPWLQPPGRARYFVLESRGWPFQSLHGGVAHNQYLPIVIEPTSTNDPAAKPKHPPKYEAVGAITVGHARSPQTMQTLTVIPYYPLWPGLIANTVIFATAWLTLNGLITMTRRYRRFRRGRCPKCAYDLAWDFRNGCPECGWRSTKRTTTA